MVHSFIFALGVIGAVFGEDNTKDYADSEIIEATTQSTMGGNITIPSAVAEKVKMLNN